MVGRSPGALAAGGDGVSPLVGHAARCYGFYSRPSPKLYWPGLTPRGSPWRVGPPAGCSTGHLRFLLSTGMGAPSTAVAMMLRAARRMCPSSTISRHAPGLHAARGLPPTRPPCCRTWPGCGRGVEERRPAGAGLGDAAVERTSTKTAGRSPPRHADSVLATEGEEWA